MGTPTPDKLAVYLVGAQTAGAALTTYTAGTGSTTTVITTTAAISNPAGAHGWFTGNTTTAALRGHVFHLRGTSGSGVAVAVPLPAAPVSGDQLVVRMPGSNRSSTEALGLTVSGTQPELAAVAGANITGVSINYASVRLGAGTLTVTYTASTTSLTIHMGSDSDGTAVDVSAGGSFAIYDATGDAYIIVTVTAASLPAGNQTDTWTLAASAGTLAPNMEGYETHSVTGGKVRFRAEAATNIDDVDSIVGLTVYPTWPSGTSTTIAIGSSLGLTAASFDATDASDWPTVGWVLNSTKNDCRQYTRSGNTLTVPACSHVTLTGNGGTAATIGATLTGGTSGATAEVIASRAGQAICKSLSGTFQVGETAGAVGTLSAVLRGFRGYTAVAWEAGDTILPMPEIDIAADTGVISTVTSETQIPADVTFSVPTAASPLSLGNLAPNGSVAVWRREWILDGATARDAMDADTHYAWS
jgi:hypothetical protein